MAKPGPKPTVLDWEQIEKLVTYQCTQEEIAAFYNVSVNLLEAACRRDLGIDLREFWKKKHAVGRVKLRKAQLEHVEKGTPGWATVAIWLDKKMNPHENPDRLPPPPPVTPEVAAIGSGLKTFTEFCTASGYFAPFPKQEEMRAFGMDLDQVRMLLGARGYGKTDFVTIMGVAYDLYCAFTRGADMSEFTNLIITKSKARCQAIIEEITNALEKNGVALDKSNASVIRVQGLIGQDHSVEAITIKTSMRGRHPKRIVMDDPVTDEDVSEAMRTTVKRRYDEAYKLCKNILIIGQPAHAFDLYAELRDRVLLMEVPHGQIPELDADLEAMKLAGIDENSISMSYHLKIPETGTSIFSGLKFVDVWPEGGTSVAFMDPSEGGDYTAMSIIKAHFSGVVVEGYAWKKAWWHCMGDVVPILKAKGVGKFCFETNKHGNQPLDQLRTVLKPLGIGVDGRYSDSNKHAVIEAAGSYSHQIHLSKGSMKVYYDQVVKYEYGAKFDDSPDSLARGLEWIGLIRGKS